MLYFLIFLLFSALLCLALMFFKLYSHYQLTLKRVSLLEHAVYMPNMSNEMMDL